MAVVAIKRRSLPMRIWRSRYVYLCLVPTFALLGVFCYYPVLEAIFRAFYKWNGYNVAEFVGLGNFVDMFHDPVFLFSIGNMVKLLLFSMVSGNVMAILTAELIFNLKNPRLQYILRLLFVIPMVVPGVVGILIWRNYLDPKNGLINALLKLVGIPPQPWLGSFHLALPSLMLIGFPWIGGFGVLIYTAGLQGISQEIFDSAAIDGATGLKRFFFVDFPLILSEIKLFVILGVIGGIQAFEGILILTGGGPGNATMVPGMYMYEQGFKYTRMGYACAVGVAMFVAILILTYLNTRYIRPTTEFEGRRA